MDNLDHVYCSTTNSSTNNHIIQNSDINSLEKYRKEIKQLKSMLILYLDLIQEQSDQIIAKDKQLAKYRSENETLRQKLEKLVNTFNKSTEYFIPSSPTKNSPANDENKDKNGILSKSSIKSIFSGATESKYTTSLTDENATHRNVIKIKKEPERQDHAFISSPITYEDKKIEDFVCLTTQPYDIAPLSPSDNIKLEVEDDDDEIENKITSCQGSQLVSSREEESNLEEELIPVDAWSPRSLPEDDENTYEACGSKMDQIEHTDEHNQPQIDNTNSNCSTSTHGGNVSDNSEPIINQKKIYKNSYMITNTPYITRNWIDETINADVEKLYHNDAKELEVPRWTVIEDSNDSNSEPTKENIDDEVYMKRHTKLELDERRRKKWDVQRIREQKNIERLKKRHLKDMQPENEAKQIASFYPNSDMIKYIQITDEIPVQAFGEAIPLLPKNVFYLPWHRSSSMMQESSPQDSSTEVKSKFLHRLDPVVQRQQKFTKRMAKKSD